MAAASAQIPGELDERSRSDLLLKRMTTLASASRLFSEKQSDINALFEAIAGQLLESMAESAAILLVGDDGYIKPAVVKHHDDAVSKEILRLLDGSPVKVGDTLLGKVAETGEPVLLPKIDVTKLPSYERPEFRAFHDKHPVSSMIMVPLRASGRTAAVLNLARYADAEGYTQEDLTFAVELADRAALALSAAQSLQSERKARADAERVQLHLARLNDLTAALSRAVSREEVARVLMERTQAMVAADQCVLLLADSDDSLRLIESHGLADSTAAALRTVPVSANLPSVHAFRTGEPLIFESADALATSYPELIRVPGLDKRMNAAVAWPLVGAAKSVGAMGFAFYAERTIDEDLRLFIRDVAKQGALALERAGLYEAERAAVRMREEFLSVASHELRTPLTPIALKLQTLSRELGTDASTERLRDHVDVMRRQLRKLTHLVNGLLDVTRIGAGKLALERREVNVADLVRDVVVRHEPEAATAGCTLYMEVPEQILAEFDPMRIEQIATNLLSNALKYGAGHPIRVSLTESARNVQLVVDDEGVGIDPKDLPRLFGRFERASTGLTFAGLGLGLYITRQIVEAHGGLIRVESAPGKGSRFEVELPKLNYTETPKSRSA